MTKIFLHSFNLSPASPITGATVDLDVADIKEVMTLIERHSVFNMGIGYTDAHLLASVLLDQCTSLWTRDKRLKLAAHIAGAALYEPFHS
jgi:hypothetical protein